MTAIRPVQRAKRFILESQSNFRGGRSAVAGLCIGRLALEHGRLSCLEERNETLLPR